MLRLVARSARALPGARFATHRSFAFGSGPVLLGAARPFFARLAPWLTLGAASGAAAFWSGTSVSAARPQYIGPNFIADAAEKALPAVVNITCGGRGMLAMSTGSGFVIEERGLIVTNAHVVATGGGVTVTLADGRVFPARIHSVDSHSDIALLEIDTTEKLPALAIGKSDSLRVGEWVVALGSPLSLSNTVTAGIVSAVGRLSSDLGLARQRTQYIQTDAAINVGNSGGPLVNLDGQVVGINVMKAQGAGGISFAIPIDTAMQVIDQLKQHRHVSRPWLGMALATLDKATAQYERQRNPDFPESVEAGVLVAMVEPGSPAERAGIQPGDVVVWFDRKPVRTGSDITDRLGFQVGRTIDVEVKRGRGGSARLKVVTEPLPPARQAGADAAILQRQRQQQGGGGFFGGPN